MEEHLIQCVQMYPLLWDPTVKGYRNRQSRKNAWDVIGKQIGASDDNCKKRWVNIRDQYKKILNKRKTRNRKKIYKFEDNLKFLLPYINIDATNNIQNDGNSDQEQSESEKDPPKSDITKLDVCKIETEFTDATIMQPPFKLSPSMNILEDKAPTVLLSPPATAPMSPSQSISRPTRQLIRKRPIRNRRGLLMRQNLTQSGSCSKVIEKNNYTEKNIHPIDAFFSGLAPTVKEFSPYYQHIAKSKIFAIVQELEMEQMTF